LDLSPNNRFKPSSGYGNSLLLSHHTRRSVSEASSTWQNSIGRRFADFLVTGWNFHLLEIDVEIAHHAGWLRGKHTALRTVDSIQIAAALSIGADTFLTNDDRLKRINEIKVLVLKDYL
jgi:predicted nucleic acid-binding protein